MPSASEESTIATLASMIGQHRRQVDDTRINCAPS